MTKSEVVQKERAKLLGIFASVEESRRELVTELIESAAFYAGENWALRQIIEKTGMIKTHPDYPELQKHIPAADEIRKNDNTLANIMKTLYAVLKQNAAEEDDGLNEYT